MNHSRSGMVYPGMRFLKHNEGSMPRPLQCEQEGFACARLERLERLFCCAVIMAVVMWALTIAVLMFR